MYDRNELQDFVRGELLLRRNSTRQQSKVIYHLVVRRRGMQENNEKLEYRESGGFQLRLPIPHKGMGSSHPGWNHG